MISSLGEVEEDDNGDFRGKKLADRTNKGSHNRGLLQIRIATKTRFTKISVRIQLPSPDHFRIPPLASYAEQIN